MRDITTFSSHAHVFLELYSSSSIGLRAQATAAVDETLRRGLTTLVVGLDSLQVLDDAVVSAVILALRRLREVGGSVQLVTRSYAHRQYLATTGLNHVFDVFASTAEAEGLVGCNRDRP